MNRYSFFYGVGIGIVLTASIFYLTFTIQDLAHNSKVNNIDIRNVVNNISEITGITSIQTTTSDGVDIESSDDLNFVK